MIGTKSFLYAAILGCALLLVTESAQAAGVYVGVGVGGTRGGFYFGTPGYYGYSYGYPLNYGAYGPYYPYNPRYYNGTVYQPNYSYYYAQMMAPPPAPRHNYY